MLLTNLFKRNSNHCVKRTEWKSPWLSKIEALMLFNFALPWVNSMEKQFKQQMWSTFGDRRLDSQKAAENLTIYFFTPAFIYMATQKCFKTATRINIEIAQAYDIVSIVAALLNKIRDDAELIRVSSYLHKVSSHGCSRKQNCRSS